MTNAPYMALASQCFSRTLSAEAPEAIRNSVWPCPASVIVMYSSCDIDEVITLILKTSGRFPFRVPRQVYTALPYKSVAPAPIWHMIGASVPTDVYTSDRS